METLTYPVPFDALLRGLPQLSERELERLAQATAFIRARAKAESLDAAETNLLLKIDQCTIPQTLKAQYARLAETQDRRSLSPSEQAQLADVIDQMELINAERLNYLIQLANLRQITLDALMDQLELHPLSAV